MNSMRGNVDERLDALLRAYGEACPTPEPSANFMPNLWQRIESRQSFTFSFQRMANAFVTAAVALSIVLGVYMSIPRSNRPPTRKAISRRWRMPTPWILRSTLPRSAWTCPIQAGELSHAQVEVFRAHHPAAGLPERGVGGRFSLPAL